MNDQTVRKMTDSTSVYQSAARFIGPLGSATLAGRERCMLMAFPVQLSLKVSHASMGRNFKSVLAARTCSPSRCLATTSRRVCMCIYTYTDAETDGRDLSSIPLKLNCLCGLWCELRGTLPCHVNVTASIVCGVTRQDRRPLG
jgi:hypothetical protein